MDIMLCCGGIYEFKQNKKDGFSMRKSLQGLFPFSSPINFFVANKAGFEVGLKQYEGFENALSAMVIGGYLTTKTQTPSKDIQNLKDRGFDFVT